MTDLDRLGGVPLVMKELLAAGLLHPDCLTVTGKTVAENLAGVPTVAELAAQRKVEQAVLRPVANPLSPPGRHMVVLTGNLASDSAVIKLSGKVGGWGAYRIARHLSLGFGSDAVDDLTGSPLLPTHPSHRIGIASASH